MIPATVLTLYPKVLRVIQIYIYYDDNEFLVDDLLIGIAIYKELMTPYGQHGVYYAVFSSLKTVRDYRDSRTVNIKSRTRDHSFLFSLCLSSAPCCRGQGVAWPLALLRGDYIFVKRGNVSPSTHILLCDKDTLTQSMKSMKDVLHPKPFVVKRVMLRLQTNTILFFNSSTTVDKQISYN